MVHRTFKANNSLSTKELFLTRSAYKYLAVPDFEGMKVPMIDFWYEDSLYGKVDRNGNAIYPITDKSLTVDLLKENPESVNTLFFMAKPYYELKSKYTALVQTKVVNPLMGYERFIVKRGLVSLDRLFEKHISQVMKYFINDFLPVYDKCITTFDDFVKYYLKFLEQFGAMSPITKTGFVMLPSTPNDISGLVLDLAFADHSSDISKQPFLPPEEVCTLDAFVELAARHGFLLDKNAPWRLVANVKDPTLINYFLERIRIFSLQKKIFLVE